MKNIGANKMIEEIRKMLEAAEKRQSEPCRTCGNCPTCGRGSYWANPYLITWPPPALPYTIGPVWVVDQGSIPRFEVTAGGVGLNGFTCSTQSVISS